VLAAHGVGADDRVLLALPDGIDLVWAFLATLWLGAVAVMVNPRLREHELALAATRCEPGLGGVRCRAVAGVPLRLRRHVHQDVAQRHRGSAPPGHRRGGVQQVRLGIESGHAQQYGTPENDLTNRATTSLREKLSQVGSCAIRLERDLLHPR
jgi:hypothetical protein